MNITLTARPTIAIYAILYALIAKAAAFVVEDYVFSQLATYLCYFSTIVAVVEITRIALMAGIVYTVKGIQKLFGISQKQ